MFLSLSRLLVCGGFDDDCWCSTVDGRCGACGLAPPRALLVRGLRVSLFAMSPACSRNESGGVTVAERRSGVARAAHVDRAYAWAVGSVGVSSGRRRCGGVREVGDGEGALGVE